MKVRPGRMAAIIAGIVAIPVVLALLVIASFGRGDRICNGVSISGIQLGGLTRAEAASRMRGWARERLGHSITLVASSHKWTGTLSDFGANVRWRQAVDQAYGVGRNGSIALRAAEILTPAGSRKRICADCALDSDKVSAVISKIARSVNVPHKDARVNLQNGQIAVAKDAWGLKLDEKKAVADIKQAFRCGGMSVNLSIVPDKPDVTTADANGINSLLAEYVTTFNPGKVDRTRNLDVAAKMIDGTILKPGEEFSYNKTVGPRIVERGFRQAQIFVKGKLEPGLGGGVCQVSSTLYNALLFADLRIVERHHHSRTVPYVDPGRDATVAYGSRDLRFVNSNRAPIAIMAKMNGNRLTVDIFGRVDEKKQIKLFTSEVNRVPAGVVTVIDPNLRAGRRMWVDKGSRGVKVTVYKTVFAPDGTKTTAVVSRDKYPRQSAVLAVGPRYTASSMRRVNAVLHPGSGSAVRVN